MTRSIGNNRMAPLAAFGLPNDQFIGTAESVGSAVAISVSVQASTLMTVRIEQAQNTSTWYLLEEYTLQPNERRVIQVAATLSNFRVSLANQAMTTQTYCYMNTYLLSSLTQDVNIRSLEASRDSVTADISGTVAVSSQPHLSYLTDNVAVATMPAITGTVAVSSQPYLSYLTDNVAVATMPAITGTVAVSSQPHLSYLTDNVAVATMPAITGSVSVSNFPAVQDISGTVAISSIATGTNLIGKVLTFENPSSTISLTNISTVGQTIKASAGSLFNITVFNDGNAISYVKLYNVALPTDLDTPVITLPVLHDSPLNTISIHNYQFTTAIGVRATANYVANDTTAPNGATSITAFFNGISP